MERNSKARTIVYIEVEEFKPTSQRPLPYLPYPMDASDRGPRTSFHSAAFPTSNWPKPPAPGYIAATTAALYLSSPPYRPASPEWVPTYPAAYGPASPSFIPRSPAYISGSPKWAPTSPIEPPASPEWVPRDTSPTNFHPTSPGPVPPSPPYIPRSPEWVPRSTSPANYCPTSPGPVPPSPPYVPRSPEWAPTSPPPATLGPTSPPPVPQSPAYTPRSPESVSRCTSPANFYPTSPGPVPPSPPYVPQSPEWASTSPPPVPLSPSSPCTSDPFAELERELDGWWGRGRFVYNRARSIVPEGEEQGQRGERETSTEPFPDLPDWEEKGDEEKDAEEDVLNGEEDVLNGEEDVLNGEEDVLVHEPAAAVPEEDLPDYEYYEQIDREEKGNAERNAEKDVQEDQVQEPIATAPEKNGGEPFKPFAFTSSHPSAFPWIRSNPFPPTPSASTREPASESEDLPDYEYYEQLEQETEAEALMQLETQHSVVDPYPDIAKLNCVPRNEPHGNTSPASEISVRYDTKEERADCLFRPSFRTSSTISSSFYRVSQKPIGRVKVQKRVDRMMWNKLMQKKIGLIIEVCEKYAPADVLKGLKR